MNFLANPTIYFVLKSYILVIVYARQIGLSRRNKKGVLGAHNPPQEEQKRGSQGLFPQGPVIPTAPSRWVMGKPLPCNVLDVLPNLQASRGLPGLPSDLRLRSGSSWKRQVSRRRNVGPALAQGQRRGYSPPAGGTTWSSSFMLVRFQIFLMMARSSSLACSRFPVGGRGLTGSCHEGLWWAGLVPVREPTWLPEGSAQWP